ncbi:MAG TPA: MarR family transcriptional regulator [Thermoanaerobaculaceae bacterium]|nr:MarR family transcriptional regulator [Thermoanaerobaculaceae bacterium]
MATLNRAKESSPARRGLGNAIRSWWMLMAEASLGEDLAIMAETGLTLPQMLTLYRLHDSSPQCVSSLAGVLHLSQPATSQLIDRLVEEGLVDRTEDPGDRRRKRLAITPRGDRLVTRLIDAKSRGLDHAAGRLSPALRRRLAAVIQEALRQLSAPPTAAPDPSARAKRTRSGNR